jgi:hypothetical protein
VPEEIHSSGRLKDSSPHSHWREALRLHALPEEILSSGRLTETCPDSHWGEALRLHALPQEVQWSKQLEKAPSSAHWVGDGFKYFMKKPVSWHVRLWLCCLAKRMETNWLTGLFLLVGHGGLVSWLPFARKWNCCLLFSHYGTQQLSLRPVVAAGSSAFWERCEKMLNAVVTNLFLRICRWLSCPWHFVHISIIFSK